MFLAVLFRNPGQEDASSLPQWVALCPWVGEQGLSSKLLVDHKVPEPQNKKGASHMLHIWMYHSVVSHFPSDASKRGLGQIILLLSLPQTFTDGPTELSPSLTREWRKCGGFIFISIFIYFLGWVTWKSLYIKILCNVICFLGRNLSPAPQKCCTNVILSQLYLSSNQSLQKR